MFKRKKEKEIDNKPLIDNRLSDSEVKLLKILINIHSNEISQYKLEEISRQDPKVKYPYGKDKIPYIKPDKKKKVKGSYNPDDN